jgi:ribonuclease P protein component
MQEREAGNGPIVLLTETSACFPTRRQTDPEKTREKDISAEQDRAQAQARLPRAHGHQGRHARDQCPPGAWPQAPFCLIWRTNPVRGGAAMQRLLKRRDFLKAQKGRRWNAGLFGLQAVRRMPEDEASPRLGFTVSKANCGKAVQRNRIRRRLKEAARVTWGLDAQRGHDYVVVARQGALTAPFPVLSDALKTAFAAVTRPRGNSQPSRD